MPTVLQNLGATLKQGLRVSFDLGAEYFATGLVCLPPAFTPSRRDDPYAFYARLRARFTPHWSALAGGFVLSRAEDVAWALHEPRLVGDVKRSTLWTSNHQHHRPLVDEMSLLPVLLTEGEQHSKSRDAISAALKHLDSEGFTQILSEFIDDCASRLPVGRPVELVEQFILPTTRTIVDALLGIPSEFASRSQQFMSPGLAFWYHEGEKLVRGQRLFEWDAQSLVRKRAGVANLFRDILNSPASGDPGRLLPVLRTLIGRGIISFDQAVLIAGEVLAAAYEPCACQLGNSILALSQRQHLWDRLRREPDCCPRAVKECERYDTAIQALFRYATEPLLRNGRTFETGQQVILLLGAANRDPEYFEYPDEIDLDRERCEHFSYGQGRHACLGRRITREVNQLALRALASQFSKIELLGRPQRFDKLPMRGISRMNVMLTA